MTLKTDITNDMKSAMKAGEKDRLRVIRMMLASIKQQEVDQRTELDDATVLAVLNRMVKQRRDSVTQFRQGGREDLAAGEEAEIAILESYLPEQLDDDAIDALITEAIEATGASGMRDMGKVMGIVKQRAEGRADLGAVSRKVKARLG
ncbi:MAG: GatB/YqeY domain-containing protein [Woeseiaceae bacterium]|nr:GatB/YqeY domain-containing protein [Woeseiaceae bacterium]